MSEQAWPTLPIPDADDNTSDDGVVYTVLIEQSAGQGNALRWLATPITQQTWSDRADARAEALTYAWNYEPRHPLTQNRRFVYQVSPDEFLTIVEGATMDFSFRTTVARPLGWRQ